MVDYVTGNETIIKGSTETELYKYPEILETTFIDNTNLEEITANKFVSICKLC
jgi:hypothetical protein